MSPQAPHSLSMVAASCPVVLTYHSISDGPSPLRIPPSLFASQMEWLASHARVVALADLLRDLLERRPLPEKTVALTFDDGFQDFYHHAAPVLRRWGFPATVFLPAAYCGRTNRWPGQPSWVDEQPLMDWPQVRELAGQAIAFGSHSLTHPDLALLTPGDAEREIAASKGEIEARTGRPADFFCYPYGRWNSAVREIVACHYLGACSTAAGVLEPDADPFALPRVDVHYLRRPFWFRSLFRPRFRSYLLARRTIRRLRGRPEGSYAHI